MYTLQIKKKLKYNFINEQKNKRGLIAFKQDEQNVRRSALTRLQKVLHMLRKCVGCLCN